MCGGTPVILARLRDNAGLSPRVRGNRAAAQCGYPTAGSIPACAGEPSGLSGRSDGSRVYPRVCGGTYPPLRRRDSSLGLSPRVRGNRMILHAPAYYGGSIPACAGEPSCSSPALRTGAVYPRVCGGTAVRQPDDTGRVGLSPRVRGNPQRGLYDGAITGSIPACAGEPTGDCLTLARSRVYPRVCGGTLTSSRPSGC